MALLRFGISKTSEEWIQIESVINKKYNGKPPTHRGTGFSIFISNELYKLFKDPTVNCEEKKTTLTKKFFALNVSDDLHYKISCEANRSGVTIGEFIARKIIDAHL